jgi:hypothetical protein
VSTSPAGSTLLRRKCACGGDAGADGECEECKKGRLQRKKVGSGVRTRTGSVVPSIVHEVLRSPGQPLDATTRASMEPRFGHDFGQVRIHNDARAAESARSVAARAYTVGSEIVFGPLGYSPGTESGRRLLAHELTHVVQQRFAQPGGGTLTVGPADDAHEREADSMAAEIVSRRAEAVPGPRNREETGTEPASGSMAPVSPPGLMGLPEYRTRRPLAAARHGVIQRDAGSPEYQQGYQDGLKGLEAAPGPLNDDALTDYNEGYGKGQNESSRNGPSGSTSPPVDYTAAPTFSQSFYAPTRQLAEEAADPARAARAASASIAQMGTSDKLIAALKSAIRQSPEAFGGQVDALLTPEALAQFAAFSIIFAELQATPAGLPVDLAIIGLEAYLVGPLVFQAIDDLVTFVEKATSAQDQPTIDQAGAALADAVGILGVAILLKLLFHAPGEKAEASKAPSGEAEIKPKSAETPAPEGAPGGEDATETPKEQSPAEKESSGGEPAAYEEPSVDGKRTIKVSEDGECVVCASPCADIRAKYGPELEAKPDLAAELDDIARSPAGKSQEGRYRELEQLLADVKAAGAEEPTPAPVDEQAASTDADDETPSGTNSQTSASLEDPAASKPDYGEPVPGSENYKPEPSMSDRPEKQHGWKWSDADAAKRASTQNKPQGRFGSQGDAQAAFEKARTLKPGETAVVDAPPGSGNILILPDGTHVPAPKLFVWVRPTGVVHAFPVGEGYVAR